MRDAPKLSHFFLMLCLAGFTAIGVGVALEGFAALLQAVLP